MLACGRRPAPLRLDQLPLDKEQVTLAICCRLSDPENLVLLFRNAAALGADAVVLGPACADWRGLDLPGHRVTLSVNGASAGDGVGANALGDPLTALTWLANCLSTQARGLDAGQVVTTGVVTPFVEIEAGDSAVADFGPLGQVRLTFET